MITYMLYGVEGGPIYAGEETFDSASAGFAAYKQRFERLCKRDFHAEALGFLAIEMEVVEEEGSFSFFKKHEGFFQPRTLLQRLAELEEPNIKAVPHGILMRMP